MTPEKANEMNKERALEIGNDSAFPNQDSNGFFITDYLQENGWQLKLWQV